jgi:hypothetical protein
MTLQKPTPGRFGPLLAGSVVLLVLGLLGFVLAAADVPGLIAGDNEKGALRGGLIILSALLVGVGAVLGMLALARRNRDRSKG